MEARLANRMEDLKEHKLAQEFFPDLAGFKSSSIYKMRGVHKRLRVRLQAYYRTEGKFDDVVFGFSGSSYVPEFSTRFGKAATAAPPLAAVNEKPTAPAAEEPELIDDDPATSELDVPAPTESEDQPEVEPPAAALPPKPSKRVRAVRRRRTSAGQRWAIAGAVAAVPLLAGIGLLLSSRTEVLAPLPDYPAATRMTGDNELALDPTLSSNGRYLAYASDKDTNGNLNIWMIALDEKGRQAKRVTRSEFEENQPAITPDGETVVFYSVRDGGSLYIVSTRGGEPRLLVKGGRRPRISPDGKMVAYWGVNREGGQAESRIHIIPIGGGTPRQLVRDFMNAEHPTWSPDGSHILFLGRPTPPTPRHAEEEPIPEPLDWWITTPEDATPRRTGALPTGMSDILFGPPGSWTSYSNRILADSMQAGRRQPIAVSMDPAYKRMGTTENLTTPGIANGQPFLANGRLASSRIEIISQMASVPINDEDGSANGPTQVLTTDAGGNEFLPALNSTGTRITYVAERKGGFNAYVRELASGNEKRLSNIPQGWSPLFSRSGSIIAVLYPTMGPPGTAGGSGAIEIHSPSGISKPIPCDRCERLVAVSNDGDRVLYTARNPRNPLWIGMLDANTRKHSTILGHPNLITSADWSPNQKLLVFGNRVVGKGIQLMIAPFSGEGEAGKPIELTSVEFNDDRPHFSNDGRLVYFLSDRDRYVCLWAMPIDPVKGTPRGEPRAVHHFHRRALAIDAVPAPIQGISTSSNRVALTVQRIRSGVFLAEPK